MYEVVYRVNDIVLVLSVVDDIESASNHVQLYKRNNIQAWYRPRVIKAA